jgi:branched-chain amino acid transport system ATP-binding protein
MTTELMPTTQTEKTPLLSAQGVEVFYGPVQILFGVDFVVYPGEIVALLGTNGAGKSTLLKAISGLVPPRRGNVQFDGHDITKLAADVTTRRGVSLMPGGKGVFPTLTVGENLRLASWLIRHDRQRMAEARQEVFDLFPILQQRQTQMAGNLSGGEQQMLALGQALMTRPTLLMIDELSLGLAPTIVSQLMEVVGQIHERGTTLVIVEQSVNVALNLARRAVFMEKGEVRFEGPTADLLERPDILRSVFIAGAAAGVGDESDGATSDGAKSDGAKSDSATSDGATSDGVTSDGERTGTVKEHRTSATAATNGHRNGKGVATVLACNDVVKQFGGIRAVDGVTFELKEGEIIGLIGHNGAGKTTLMDCLSGFLELNRGRIRMLGYDITELAPYERAKAGLGRSFQDALLFPSLTVAETIAVARERWLASRDMVAAAFQLPASYESELAVAHKVDELIDLMGLEAFREKLTGELSTGSRRIVDLTCILAQDPRVLMLDEPSSGVAQKETEALGPLLLRVRDRTGCSLIVIEHDMPLISTISDRMICLELGGIIAEGPPNEVLEHPQVIESYLGSDQSAIKRSGAGEAPATKSQEPPRRTRPLRAAGATAARSRAR